MGQPFGIDSLTYPVKSAAVRQAVAREDRCPECGGDLDTGWECSDCGFDARELVYPEWQRRTDKKWGAVE